MQYQFIDSLRHISADQWNQCAPQGNPTISYEFLNALEASQSVDADSGWISRHLIVRDEQGICACVPLYLKTHSYGEYIFDHVLAHNYQRLGWQYYPKLLSAIPYTPVTAPQILVHARLSQRTRPRLTANIIEQLKSFASANACSGFHFNFIDSQQARALANNGMLIRKTHQYHWHNQNFKNFDDFLNSLTSRKRKNIKAERNHLKSLGITHRHFSGASLTDSLMDVFYQFYLYTYDRKWGFAYLKREFFHHLVETMPERILLILGYQDGEPVSGALNFIDKDGLIGRNWGYSRAIKFLHFETCYYQALDFACEHGLTRVEAGTQGEQKLLRGYDPVATYSAHYLLQADMMKAYGDYLQEEGDAMNRLISHLQQFTPYKKLECNEKIQNKT